MVVDDEMGYHWRIALDENKAGRYEGKYLLHAKRWGVYMGDKISLIKGGYSMEF